jgi:serine/threonine protein kinase
MPLVCNIQDFTNAQEESIFRLLQNLPEGFLAHNILMQDPTRPMFPNEHDIVYLAPWAAYTIESKGVTFKYVRLPGNSPAEWELERPQWGTRGKLVYLPGRQNPLHIAWKKSQMLLSHYVRKRMKDYPVYGLVVFPDHTQIDCGGKENIFGIRACNMSRMLPLLIEDRKNHHRLYPLVSIKQIFADLEALPARMEPPFTIERLDFLHRRDRYDEPGCPVPVQCYDGRENITGMTAEIRVYDTQRIDHNTDRFFRRVRRRMSALYAIADPNVIKILYMSRWPNADVIAYQAYDGETLRKAVQSRGKLDPFLAASVVSHVCTTVARLHRLTPQIMHLDIRPEHVLVGSDLERHLGADHVLSGLTNPVLNDDLLTGIGEYKNAFDRSFVAPGVREPGRSERRDPRNDIYSLGALLAYCVMGERDYFRMVDLTEGIRIAPNTSDDRLNNLILTATHGRNEMRHDDASSLSAALSVLLSTGTS